LDILRRPLTAAQTAAGVDLVSSPSHEYAANISPDGRYFAYVSIAPDRPPNVYVRSYLDAGSPAVSISTAGGAGPVWSRGSKELFYLDASNTLMAVSVSTSGPQFTFRKPVRVFETKYSGGNFYSYDVTKDGRFLMLKEAIDADLSRARIVVVLNWFEELKKLAPAK
jgi:Tol biopolymer transport system component